MSTSIDSDPPYQNKELTYMVKIKCSVVGVKTEWNTLKLSLSWIIVYPYTLTSQFQKEITPFREVV